MKIVNNYKKGNIMKILMPVNGENLESPINRSFGRTKQFLLIDSETLEFEIIENKQNMTAAQGAGIQSAQTVIKAGAEVVITTHCGPKAFRVLNEGGAKIFFSNADTVKENLEQFKANNLEQMNDANVEGHWV
jgi:predicted Fe-Mo cluster-binding NifX family protein